MINNCYEDEVLTDTGCTPIDDLQGDEVILDTWDCSTDGNGICGEATTEVPVTPIRDDLPRTGMEGSLTGIALLLIFFGTALKRRFA